MSRLSEKANLYLSRYGAEQVSDLKEWESNTELVIVIPVYAEPDIISTLESLSICSEPDALVSVILVINSSTADDDSVKLLNDETERAVLEWQRTSGSFFRVHIVSENDLPQKHAGVGLARKIGMDTALLMLVNSNKLESGLIVCLDADSLVDSNYLVELDRFRREESFEAFGIYYEHDLNNCKTSLESEGIYGYELHLRYYVHALRFAGLNHAYQTIGSAMGVRPLSYAEKGGMNKRKAGEDFYFLHKFIDYGQFSELLTTRVIPSSRVSERVPFGTGKAMKNWFSEHDQGYLTYSFDTFKDLREFFLLTKPLFNVSVNDLSSTYERFPNSIKSFISEVDYSKSVINCIEGVGSDEIFQKKLIHIFGAFWCMRFSNYCKDNIYDPQEVVGETVRLLTEKGADVRTDGENEDFLLLLRNLDR